MKTIDELSKDVFQKIYFELFQNLKNNVDGKKCNDIARKIYEDLMKVSGPEATFISYCLILNLLRDVKYLKLNDSPAG